MAKSPMTLYLVVSPNLALVWSLVILVPASSRRLSYPTFLGLGGESKPGTQEPPTPLAFRTEFLHETIGITFPEPLLFPCSYHDPLTGYFTDPGPVSTPPGGPASWAACHQSAAECPLFSGSAAFLAST